ncbi:MAG: tetratricopeptide repeat protein, partial [Bryobacteraceae bacterium]
MSCKVNRPAKTLIILNLLLGWGLLAAAQAEAPSRAADRARIAMDEGRFPEAIEIYRDLLKNDASNAGLVMNLGLALDAADKPREAIAQFDRVLKLDPDFAPAYLAAGSCWKKLGQPAKALEAFEHALVLEPGSRKVHLELADTHYELGHFERAVEFYERYTSVDIHQVRSWKQLGLSYVRLGRARAAELRKIAPTSRLWTDLVADSDLYGDAASKSAAAQKPPAPEPDCSKPSRECEFLAGHYRQIIAAVAQAKTPESLFWQARCYEELAFRAFSQLSDLLPP